MPGHEPATLSGHYFDGVSARAIPVTLLIDGSRLHLRGAEVERWVALAEVQWPERTRHGLRVAHFRSGGTVQCSDAAGWDAWRRASGQREPLIVTLQQSWRWVLVSVLLLLTAIGLVYQWGLPVGARMVVAVMPPSLDAALGESTLALLDEHLMSPSKLPATEQARLQDALRQVLKASPQDRIPPWQLVFRQSRIGPNALALPGGTLVLTDELVALVGGDEAVVSAVLAHEVGHLQHRHSMRMLVQASVLGALSSVLLGDFSTLLAGIPLWLGQASYSREAEREADTAAVQILQAADLSPRLMLTLFEQLEVQRQKDRQDQDDKSPAQQPDSWLGIAFASHPSDAERVRFFQAAAR